MRQILRFLLFDRPDRQSTTQIHPDIEVNDPPRFGYGEGVGVGADDTSPLDWPTYIVADITHGKQIADPHQAERNALVFQVFLARESEWSLFKMPDHVRQMFDEGEK